MEGFAKELMWQIHFINLLSSILKYCIINNRQKQNLEGDVFDVLREFTDFQSFKDMMIDLNMVLVG